MKWVFWLLLALNIFVVVKTPGETWRAFYANAYTPFFWTASSVLWLLLILWRATDYSRQSKRWLTVVILAAALIFLGNYAYEVFVPHGMPERPGDIFGQLLHPSGGVFNL